MIPFFATLFRFVSTLRCSLRDPDFHALASLVALTLLSGTLFYCGVEGWSLLDSLYFSVVTLTTVRYGDLSPTTAFGKVFTFSTSSSESASSPPSSEKSPPNP